MKKFYLALVLGLVALTSMASVPYVRDNVVSSDEQENVLLKTDFIRLETGRSSADFEGAWIEYPLRAQLSQEDSEVLKKIPYLGFAKLIDEGNQTVLHCYLVTGNDNMNNIWLGGDETYIVDAETGVRYKARGSYSPSLWNQTFGVKVPKGTILDFPIYFPKLPKSVKKIKIYGIPHWSLRGGGEIWLRRMHDMADSYDTIPCLRVPKLEYPAHNYDKDNMDTYSCYNDAHLLAPMEEYAMAAWFTPETTYLAIAYELNWTKEYYGFQQGTVLVDNATGKKYKLRKVQGLPMKDLFFIHGVVGDMFAMVLEFEPLPLSATNINYLEADGEPFHVWGASWRGNHITNRPVPMLRENQAKFKYYERKVVE